MRITVQITVESGGGESEMVEVACLERGSLRPDTLGLSLAEARAILAGLEQTLVERQAAEFVAQAQRCSQCGRGLPCKGHHQIVFRTPFFWQAQVGQPTAVSLPMRNARSEERQPLGGATL